MIEGIEILGFFSALLIGFVIGLLGGGGSILAVPVFVYLFSISPITATAYSLFVVGLSAIIGVIINTRRKLVDYRTGIIFALPALVSVYLTVRYLIPAIPDEIFSIGSFKITKDIMIMLFFAVVMFVAAISMIRGRKDSDQKQTKRNYPLIFLVGLFVGILTGTVGAGGGFLIVPALALYTGLTMKQAIATSLLVISFNSIVGFAGDLQHITVDWEFLLIFAGLAVIGVFVGLYLNRYAPGKKLKVGFGWFVLVMSIIILTSELVM